jgi:two-component system NarL family response regulator
VATLGVSAYLEDVTDIAVVGIARTGQSALRHPSTETPTVLVVEPALPDLRGQNLVRELSGAWPDAALLFFSAYDDDEFVYELMQGRVSGYVSKHDAPEFLLAAIRGVGSGERDWASPKIAQRAIDLQRSAGQVRKRRLTNREQQALRVLAQGAKNAEIAQCLCVSIGTVKNHLTSIYEKLGVDNRAEAIVWAHRHRMAV